MATTTASLHHFDMRWDQRSAVTVVMANKGYPGIYVKGDVIRNLEVAEQTDDCYVFHAGTARDNKGDVIADGGRVLTVTALGNDTASARKNAYEVVTKITWDTCFYRSDIGNV